MAFVRKRTPVDREAEVSRSTPFWWLRARRYARIGLLCMTLGQIMSFFGSIPQQQSLGIGEFIAVLRLVRP